jgi:hypothetical protein
MHFLSEPYTIVIHLPTSRVLRRQPDSRINSAKQHSLKARDYRTANCREGPHLRPIRRHSVVSTILNQSRLIQTFAWIQKLSIIANNQVSGPLSGVHSFLLYSICHASNVHHGPQRRELDSADGTATSD